jgi:opacity protein-like surface antigen
MKKTLTVTALALLAVLSSSARAQAQDEGHRHSLEGFFGYYDPDESEDHGEVYGGRFGYRPGDNFGLLLSAGVIDLEDDILDIEDSNLRFNLGLVDLSFQWYPGGSNFYVFAGPGWARIDLEVDIPGPDNDFESSDDVLTANAGLGYQWKIGDSFFIRPEGKVRWFDETDFDADDIDSYKGLDREYSIALGWRF